jgi:TM2 domain-containing membrane protein YozV
MGIESLSRNYYNGAKPKSKARLAALFALLPGMGAVYNRQNLKAVAHFIGVMGLFNLTRLGVFGGLFALAGFLFYIYSIVDAYRTSESIAQGESPAAGEEHFKRMLVKRAPFIGAILIIGGTLLVIEMVRPVAFLTFARLFPVALILLGGYLLTTYFKRSREENFSTDYSAKRPYQLVPDSFEGQAPERFKRLSRPGDRR